MVILGTWRNRALTISIKANSLTVSLQSNRSAEVYSYDQVGRLWTAMKDGVSYRRGLNGSVVAKWKTGIDSRERRWLQFDEANILIDHARQTLSELYEDIGSGTVQLSSPLDQLAHTFFQNATHFNSRQAQADAGLYGEVYKPVGILPPDQYMAVVLQLTEGCSFNTCTFCSFYKERPFRIKSPAEFRLHAEAVKNYLGDGLSLRRTIFLGDANALVVPMRKLLPLLDVVHETFDVAALGGMFAFLDGFSGERKTASDFAELAKRDVRRVYVGLESGNNELLQFLKKPGTAQDALRAVQAMKQGGLSVGVIVLLGAGGHQFAKGHVKDTIQVINEMNLDADDLLYFSELIESEKIPYVQDAYQSHLHPLTPEERIAQGEEIERNLDFSVDGGTPHISRYDIREFVY